MKQYLTIALILLTTTLFAQSTSWNEYKLKEHWKTNGADEIEGIYENTVSEWIIRSIPTQFPAKYPEFRK